MLQFMKYSMYNPVDDVAIEVDKFLNGSVRNQYVSDPHGICVVYIRKGLHYINGATMRTFDIANISVESGLRGSGIGISAINKMHEMNPFQATFVESLLNEGLHQRLLNDGWNEVEGSIPPCVYKMVA